MACPDVARRTRAGTERRVRAIKAVIAVAGAGSRFFPIGKTINKSMLPILDRPVLDYAVADCVAAGAQEIAVVVGPGPAGQQVRHYLSHDTDLEQYFAERGWEEKYKPLADLHTRARFTFIEQPRTHRYGTALPAMIAADWVGADDFLLIAGDDLLLRQDGGSDLADLVRTRAEGGASGAIAAASVPGTQAYRYGVLRAHSRNEAQLLDGFDEKPLNYEGATAYINISRSLLPSEALDCFRALKPSPVNGEYQATDAIAAFARDHDLLVHPVQGAYHDCGNPAGWLTANNAAARLTGEGEER
ncbi:sugar phosphate nucleotidyltransferase [Streptomyces sp. NPDC049954]|uniref:sugar phosphate nucleotidyltransferase n=1 Tax=Streptomyces sp. NPDC049954 TaxID=3155779 RepID=UPI0034243FCC